jgi:hypothetical protein|tara:strand:+ start:1056 stop:1250 length:195 start_codon:yes stop_codon:yes gene_type:complete
VDDRSQAAATTAPDRCILEGQTMAKGKNSKKEAKKPKQEKPKVSATANSNAGKPALSISGKTVK